MWHAKVAFNGGKLTEMDGRVCLKVKLTEGSNENF